MKSYFAALILSLGLIQSSTPPATIEGRVLRAGTGEPIANTPVTLISTGSLSEQGLASLLDQISQLVTIGLQGGGGSQDITIRQVASVLQSAGPGVSNQASVLTDRAGHFSFTDLQRGRYTVWVQRFNYFGPLQNGVPTATASSTITLDPAKAPPPVDLFMTQGMAISGRILDGRGQPASGMTVTAYRATISDGRLIWSPVLSRPIDDRGEYPVNLSAQVKPWGSFKISGVAINPLPNLPPNPVTGVINRAATAIVLMPLDLTPLDNPPTTSWTNLVATNSKPNGEFVLSNVDPGRYELYAMANDAQNRRVWTGHVRVEVLAKYQSRGRALNIQPQSRNDIQLDLISAN